MLSKLILRPLIVLSICVIAFSNASTAQAEPSANLQTASLSVQNNYYPSPESLRSRSRVDSLVQQLHCNSDVLRTHAATDMAYMQRPARELVPALSSALLSDTSKWVRRAAARSLGKIGSPSAISALNAAVHDRDVWVAHSARNSLLRITGGR